LIGCIGWAGFYLMGKKWQQKSSIETEKFSDFIQMIETVEY
jgi:hypothetical protein